MLQSLRKGAASWVAKLFLGLLVLSFAVWGIGDIFRGFGRQTVATIGHTEISVESFRQLYNQRLQNLSRQISRPITAEQARAFGLDQQMLGEMIAEAALDERASQLGLGIGDDELIRRIQENPAFRGSGGQFDRGRFDQTLRNNGFTEAGYVASERRLTKRQQIARAVSGGVAVPKALGTMVSTYQSETRKVDFVAIGREAAGDIATPKDDELVDFFEQRKASFRSPEYRKLAVLALTVDTLAPWIEVSDQDVAAFYEANRSRFGSPEQRTLQQIVFPNAEDAAAAAARIAAGDSFEDIAAARGLKASDIDIGTVGRAGLLDPAIADAAFALAEGAVSGVVPGRFGHALLRVLKIQPERLLALGEIADQIRRQIATDRAKRDLLDRHDKIEDERAAGHTLAEVAAKVGLPLETIDAVDRSGRDAEGAQIATFPAKDEVLQGAFRSDVGSENDPIQMGSNGFVWYDVLGVTRARDRTFAEAKEQVLARWQEEQAAELVKAKAESIAERVRKGEPLATVAAAEGLTLATAADVRRAGGSAELPADAVPTVFETAVGAVATAAGENAIARLVVQVVEAGIPDAAKDTAQLDAELRRAIEDDLLAQYVSRLQTEVGVKVNRRIVDQIVGRDTGS